MWSTLSSVFGFSAVNDSSHSDPREPDVMRTPPREWTRRSALLLDPRSPSLGIARSPLSGALRWDRTSLAPVQLKQEQAVQLPEKQHKLIMPAPTTVPELTPLRVDEEQELAKLRREFSAKKTEQQQIPTFSLKEAMTPEGKLNHFLSSPALWRTIHSSPSFHKTPDSVSDPLLRNSSPASAPRRRELFRHDSATAA